MGGLSPVTDSVGPFVVMLTTGLSDEANFSKVEVEVVGATELISGNAVGEENNAANASSVGGETLSSCISVVLADGCADGITVVP